MSAPDRVPRLLALLPWLVAHPGASVGEVAEHFDVSGKTLLADIELLTLTGPGQYGGELVDVEITSDERIYVTDPQTMARPLRLTADEATALLVGLRLLAQVPGVSDRDALVSAEAKLSDAVATDPAVHVAVAPVSAAISATIDAAMARGEALELSYLNANRDELTERTVDPLRTLVLEGRPYLEAWCRSAEAVRTFRVDRITAARLAGEPANPPRDVGSAPLEGGRLVPTGSEQVTFLLSERGRWVVEQIPHDSVEETPAGLLVRLRAADERWVVRLALALGGDGRLLEPAHYVQALVGAAESAVAPYQD